jgi:ribA/ribD-fused uncharacterized protein
MISSFSGEYRFLSNFYPAPVSVDIGGQPMSSATSEHVYQAAKTTDREEQLALLRAPTPGAAKSLGRHVKLRSDWTEIRLEIMEKIVRAKFWQNPHLARKLVATGDQKLVEGNRWNDTFWGVCRGVGENHLGKILMRVREELRGE